MDGELDLAGAWRDAQAQLPPGWQLDSLQCASTGLGEEERSDDWVAVAIGPAGDERRVRAADPVAALDALARDLMPG